jgi:hypothetical protein
MQRVDTPCMPWRRHAAARPISGMHRRGGRLGCRSPYPNRSHDMTNAPESNDAGAAVPMQGRLQRMGEAEWAHPAPRACTRARRWWWLPPIGSPRGGGRSLRCGGTTPRPGLSSATMNPRCRTRARKEDGGCPRETALTVTGAGTPRMPLVRPSSAPCATGPGACSTTRIRVAPGAMPKVDRARAGYAPALAPCGLAARARALALRQPSLRLDPPGRRARRRAPVRCCAPHR